ncbi:POK10 protein, partial [Jacana jacana]|nr:POK10 protein [Jacana jacana]
IAKGNAQADLVADLVVVPNTFEQACLSHEFCHQNAKASACHFSISKEQAQAIVACCLDCQQVTLAVPVGINPQGLSALELWQTDVTHVPDFGRLKYMHVSVDTFFGMYFCLLS